jgi:hypothetical protein
MRGCPGCRRSRDVMSGRPASLRPGGRTWRPGVW